MSVANVLLAPSARKPPLPALTGLRTLLALNIVFFHFAPPHVGPFRPFMQNGFVFVGFFFLLSGYVLAYNYADRALTLNLRSFWVARFARLYPVYLLALLLSFRMLRLEWTARPHAEFWQGLILTPLLLQGWSPSLATFWNTVGWTLSCELLLYALFPYVIRAWARHGTWTDTPTRLVALFFILWCVGMVPHALYLMLNPDHLPQPIDRYSYGLWLRALKYSPAAYVCMFLAGMTLGKLQLSLTLTARQRLMVAALGLAALAIFFYTALGRVPYVILHGGLLMPLFATLTIGLSGESLVATLFSWRPLLLIGESTFCLYMLHFNGINFFNDTRLWSRLHLAVFDPWISYAAILAVALAVHHVVENPARRAILDKLLPQITMPRQSGASSLGRET